MLRWLALCLTLAAPLSAQTAAETATDASNRLLEAGRMMELAQTRADRVSALTETVQAYEDGLIAMREGLRQAAIRERTLIAQLDAKSVEVSRLLGILLSMERAPEPLLLLHPQGALGTARGGMITADLAPALQAEVTELRAQLSEVAILRTLQEQGAGTLQEGLDGAQNARAALALAISERTDLPRRFVTDRVQMQLLADSAQTLDRFAEGLLQTTPAGEGVPETLAKKGQLLLPVRGQLLREAGEPDASGVRRPGIIIAARPRAIVRSPVAATVLFAGPLLDYGNVVIVEPAVNVMFVIAGLGDVYVTPGEVLNEGAPLGLLGGTAPDVDDILTQRDEVQTGNASQTLYLEVRDGQSPVDPGQWFALD